MKIAAILVIVLLYCTSARALTTGQTVVLAGQAIAGSDTLKYAQVNITLAGGSCYTSTDLMPGVTLVTYADVNGNWSRRVVGTDSIFCVSSQKATYTVEIKHPVLDQSGQQIRYQGLVIPATNGATTQLRTIVSQQ